MRAKPGSRHCDVGSDCQHLPSTAHFSTFSCAEWCPANFLMCPIMILCLLKMKGNTPHLGFYNCTGVLRAEKHSFYFIIFFWIFIQHLSGPFVADTVQVFVLRCSLGPGPPVHLHGPYLVLGAGGYFHECFAKLPTSHTPCHVAHIHTVGFRLSGSKYPGCSPL